MNHETPVQINITINTFMGDAVNSAIIQGGDGNKINISSGSASDEWELLTIYRRLSIQAKVQLFRTAIELEEHGKGKS